MKYNKRGEFMFNIIILFIMVVIFFMLFEAPQAVIDAVKVYAPDNLTALMLSLIPLALLIGLIKWAFETSSGGAGGE